MRIRCWGSRGSFPASRPEFVRYGGDTSCVEVESSKGDIVLFDAGTGIRGFGSAFGVARERAIHLIFTHYHLDHIVGFPGFAPIYDRNTALRIYGPGTPGSNAESVLRNIMRAPCFPVDFSALPAEITFHEVGAAPFTIGALTVTPIRLNHPNGGCGYRVDENGTVFAFLTDNELEYGKPGFDAGYFEGLCQNADLLIHDGEYTDEEYLKYETWGHSKYTDAIKLAIAANVKRLGIYHANANRTDDGMDEIVKDAKRIIADKGSEIECYGIKTGFEITI